jgi:hypothetical protein
MREHNTREASESSGGPPARVVDGQLRQGSLSWSRFFEALFRFYFFFPYYVWATWSSFYFPRQRQRTSVSKDTVATLVEYARAGRRDDFFWLARASGIDRDGIEAFWRGVRGRLGLTS